MIIVKIGGGDGLNINGIIADLAGLDDQYIIVHGANALRDKLARRSGTAQAGADLGQGLHQRLLR